MSSGDSDAGRTTAKRAAVEAAVLRATEELLAEEAPFADIGIERIATRAGISRTAFYFYFRDKKELLKRLTAEISADLYAQADIWFSSEEDDAREALRTALARIGGIYTEHGPLLRAIVEVSTYEPEIAGFWRQLIGRFVDATAVRIEEEQPPGTAGSAPAHATAFALVWMVERTFYEQLVQDTPFDPDELLDGLVAVFMRTIYGRT